MKRSKAQKLIDVQDVAAAICMDFECEDAPFDCVKYRGGLCLCCRIRIALRDQTPPKPYVRVDV